MGGFGISDSEDLLRIDEIALVQQTCSWAHVAFHDESVADYFDEQVDQGRGPETFARIWIHTHPGNCPQPSGLDEETFARVFGSADWAVMFILAQEGKSYARLRFNSGPGAAVRLRVEVDYSQPFPGCDEETWERDYLQHVQPERSLARNRDWSTNFEQSEEIAITDSAWSFYEHERI